MRRPGSIRSRLIRQLILGLLGLSVATAVVVYLIARGALTRQFDQTLLTKAQAIAALVEDEGKGELEFELARGSLPEFETPDSPSAFQIWKPDGTVLARSASLQQRDLTRLPGNGEERFGNIVLPNGTPARMVEFTFLPQPEHGEERPRRSGRRTPPGDQRSLPKPIISICQSRAPLDSTLSALAIVLLAGGLLIPLGGTLLVLGAVSSSLRPLGSLADEVRTLGPDSLERRFATESAPSELVPIHLRLNELLSRLQAAFERERRFTSDVSHELRTPLAEARTAVEMAARWPKDSALHEAACQDALGAIYQMQGLVLTLLLLARAETGAISLQTQPLDLGELTAELIERLARHADSREIQLTLDESKPPLLETDRILLASILRNLLENAVEYAPSASKARVTIQAGSPGPIRWSISNQAPDLSQEDIPKLFHPFWRKDASRTGEAHSGLGLSLVASFSQILGYEVEGKLSLDGILTVEVVIPAPCLTSQRDQTEAALTL